MIPCFPANNSTDVHHCDIVSSRSSPSHFTKDTPFHTFPSQNQVNYKKIKPLFWKIKKDIIWEIEIRENAHAAILISGWWISFWNLFILRKEPPIYYLNKIIRTTFIYIVGEMMMRGNAHAAVSSQDD